MTITSDYSYLSPDIAEAMEEAFERAGVDPRGIGQDHIGSCLRSIKLLFAEWQTYGVRQWMVNEVQQTLTTADIDFDLPAGAIDVVDAVLLRAGRSTPMYPMGRNEYLEIPDKTVQGRPTRYFVDKQYDRVTLKIWQAPQNSTDVMWIYYVRQMANPGAMANTLQMPPPAMECFHAGLSMKIAQKYSPERYDMLRIDYGGPRYPEVLGGKIFHMRAASAENADTEFTIRR